MALITPTIDLKTAAACVDHIAPWNDGMGAEWRTELPGRIGKAAPRASWHRFCSICVAWTDWFIEAPQLVTGDTTILQPDMVLAVDGSVSVDTFRAQVGDSFIVTDDGYEALTDHPKSLEDVVL